jgi:hypothetical protein
VASWAKFFESGDDKDLPEGVDPGPATDADGEPVNPVTGASSTGCQHANMKTNGLATWCEDCGLSDLA